jgi:hypothetical protein
MELPVDILQNCFYFYTSERVHHEYTIAVKRTYMKGYEVLPFLLFYVYEAHKMTCRALKCFDITTDLLHCIDGELRVLMLSCLMKRYFALWFDVSRTNHCVIKHF